MKMLNSSRLILPAWQRFLVLLILFAGTLVLWLMRAAWIPLFSLYLGEIEQKANILGVIDSMIDIGGAILNAVILLLVILTGTRLIKDDREELAIVRAVIIDDLQAQLGSGGRVKWIDRAVVTPQDLAEGKKILIVGRANLGKTREAIELVKASVNQADLVAFNRIYEPAPPLFLRNPTGLRYPIQQHLDLYSSLLILLDDLPERFPPDRLGLASALLSELDAKGSLFVVATADESRINQDYKKWLEKEKFRVVELRSFNSVEAAELARLASQGVGINLTQEGIDHIVSFPDLNPRRIQTAMHLLAVLGKDNPTITQISNVMPLALSDAWKIERNLLFRRMPPARHLLEALTAFSRLDLASFTSLVIPFASQIWAQQQKYPILSWNRERILGQTLIGLSSYDIVIHAHGIILPEHMLESGLLPDNYSGILKTYLLSQARRARLRFAPPKRNELLFCLLQLGERYLDEPGGHESAENLFRAALQITGNRSFGSHILSGLTRLRIRNVKPINGTRAYSRDIEWSLHALRGVSFALGEKHVESLVSLDKAIGTAISSQDSTQYLPDLLMLRGIVNANSGSLSFALRDLNQAISLDPTDPALFRLRAETHHELGNSKQALSDISIALELKPDYWEALYWKAFLQMQALDKRGAIASIAALQEVSEEQGLFEELGRALHIIKGSLFKDLGELENARAEYTTAISTSEDYDLYQLRGVVNAYLLDYEGALSDFKRARELAPNDHDKERLPGEGQEFDTFFIAQSSKVARSASAHMSSNTRLIELLRAIETSPNDPALHYALSLHFFDKDIDLSLHFIDRAISVAQDDHALYGFRAGLDLMSGNLQQALSDYRVAADLSPHPKIADYYLNQISAVDRAAKDWVESFTANELPGILKKVQENV